MTAPRSLGIGRLPSGGLAIVDERGVQIPAERRITTTASDLSRLLAAGIEISIRDAAEVVGPGMVAGLRKAMQAGSEAGAKAGAQAGFDAGARYVLKNSRRSLSIERDEQGRVTGAIEARELE